MLQLVPKFKLAQKNDVCDILQISDVQLGKNYLTSAYLYKSLEHKNEAIHIVTSHNRVLGFLHYERVIENDFVSTYLTQCKSVDDISDKIVVNIKHAAIHPDFSGKGIGNSLFSYVLNEVIEPSLRVYSLAWSSKDEVFVAPILVRNGFKPVCKIHSYWYKESVNKKYQCPICGNPCSCDAVVFRKN